MSDFKFKCPHCGQGISTGSSMVGREVPCPKCSGRFIVPNPPASRPQIPPAKAGSKNVCPYCRSKIAATDLPQVCPACRTPHHADCWKENNGCTVYGCSMAPPDEEKISISLSPGTTTPPQMPGARPPSVLYKPKTNAPGATSSLVWGILGFFFCGVIFGCVAISNANKAKKLIQAQPGLYTGTSFATAGLVIGIIDLVLWGLLILGKLAGGGS